MAQSESEDADTGFVVRMRGLKNFWYRWPGTAKVGLGFVGLSVLLFAWGLLDLATGRGGSGTLAIGAFPLAVGLLVLAFAISDDGRDEVRVRGTEPSFPLSRNSWLVRPPRFGALRASYFVLPGLMFLALVVQVLLIPPLVVVRVVQLLVKPSPVVGDLVSMRDANPPGGFLIAQVAGVEDDNVLIRVFSRSERRRRGIHVGEIEQEPNAFSLSRSEYDARGPRFVWRGALRFWNSADPGRPFIGHYSAIEDASARVSELERQGEI